MIAIASPARWATTLETLSLAELPRVAWETAVYVAAPEPLRYALAAPLPEKRTHCPQGHPCDAENTYVDPDGYRHCRICGREFSRAYKQQRRDTTPAQPAPRSPRPGLAIPPTRAAASDPPVPPRPLPPAESDLGRARARIAARREKQGVAR